MPSPPQALVAQHLLLSGCALFLSGLLWGPFVGSTTYPRLALGAHIQFTLNGIYSIAVGLIIGAKEEYVKLSNWQANWIWWGFIVCGPWPSTLSELPNAWWGARGLMPIVAAQAGITVNAKWWQDAIVVGAHMAGVPAFVGSWVILLYALAQGVREKKAKALKEA